MKKKLLWNYLFSDNHILFFNFFVQVDAVRTLGGEFVTVELEGNTFDEAQAYALQLVQEKGYKYIPPFDDPGVIKGQGTINKIKIIKNLKYIFLKIGLTFWKMINFPQLN